MVRTIPILLVFLTCASHALSANILFTLGIVSSYSHRSALEPLAEALAARGHNVTFYAPMPSKNKTTRISTFYPKAMVPIYQTFFEEFGVLGLQSRVKQRKNLDLAKGFGIYDLGIYSTEQFVNDSEFQNFFDQNSFDLFIIDRISMTEVFYALAWKQKAKVISYSAVGMVVPYEHYHDGYPVEAWGPVFDVPRESVHATFWQRFWSEYSILAWYFSEKLYYTPPMDKILREGLQEPELPSLLNLCQSHVIILSNQHYSDAFPRSLPPFVIPVGGIAVTPSDGKIPKELEAFVKESNDGFVYISFGSIVTISTLPESVLQVFMDAIAKFPHLRFLWKWEGEFPQNAPSNILFQDWFPQNDVLAHPKILGYIGQGGQISLQQAIYHGVPTILFPVNGDQDLNALRLEHMGNGVSLEFCGLTTQELTDAIKRITTEKSFQIAAKKLSTASKNRPISPLDSAVWWTEFVLSQDDLSYLKPPVDSMPWWMQRQLDVFAVMAVSVLTVIFMILSLFFYCAGKLLDKVLGSGVQETGRKSKKKTL